MPTSAARASRPLRSEYIVLVPVGTPPCSRRLDAEGVLRDQPSLQLRVHAMASNDSNDEISPPSPEAASFDHPEDPEALEDAEYDVVDFYASTNPTEVNMLVDILRDNGVVCFTREMEPPGLPVSVGHEGQIRILVQDNRLELARSLLEEAIAEGPVPDDGTFLRD